MKYKLMKFLMSWLFPTKSSKETFAGLCRSLNNRDKVIRTHKRYPKILKKLKNKKKIKVAFIVSENAKWGYQYLYELFEKSEKFEPIILITLLTSVHSGKDKTRYNTEENYDFFKKRGMNVEYLYKDGIYLDLKKVFKPDIVFWDQPWDLPKKYQPKAVSEYALTLYCSYCFEALEDSTSYINNFHAYLYKYFVEHELNIDRYKRYSEFAQTNCVVTGYPKLDAYCKKLKEIPSVWKNPENIKIIYAPHHSFDNYLQLATFDKNHDFILNLAKKYPNTTWIFKPHPRLKYALLKMGYMTECEIEKYYEEWAKIGTVYTQGDYFDIFKSSDAMITDCMSFLTEYLPSQKPLIRLMNPKARCCNKLGEKILGEYYNVYDNETLEKTFVDVVINKNDSKKEKRQALIKEIFDYKNPSSEKIYKYINQFLFGEK